MIKANELRIGNYMQDRKWYLCEVTRLSKDVDEIKIESIDNAITYLPCEPIPLTEQWLLDFGFEKSRDNEHWFIGHFGFCLWFDGLDWCLKNLINERTVIAYVRYVHEIQNLYMPITKKELTLKQPI